MIDYWNPAGVANLSMGKKQFNERLGANLRRARELANISQLEAGAIVGVHRPTVSEIEAGKRKATAEELAGFAKAYGTTAGWLLSEETSRDPAIERAARLLLDLKKEDLSFVLRLIRLLKLENAKSQEEKSLAAAARKLQRKADERHADSFIRMRAPQEDSNSGMDRTSID